MQLVSYARAQVQLMRTPPSLPQELAFDSATAASIIQTAVSASQSVLSEVEAKNLLAAYGIPTVQTWIATNPAQVGRLAQDIIARHGACVIKILSDDISHKSDVGGVRLGLEHAEEAERTAADMVRRIVTLSVWSLITTCPSASTAGMRNDSVRVAPSSESRRSIKIFAWWSSPRAWNRLGRPKADALAASHQTMCRRNR